MVRNLDLKQHFPRNFFDQTKIWTAESGFRFGFEFEFEFELYFVFLLTAWKKMDTQNMPQPKKKTDKK